MRDAALETILRRDRYVVLAALLTLTLLAWAYVLWLSLHMATPSTDIPMSGMNMPGMDMPGMDMGTPTTTAVAPITVTTFLFTFLMWAVMMIGMMTPSAAPMLLLYAQVGRQAALQGKPFAATGWFAAGYFLAWTGFSLLASAAQAALSAAALLTPMMMSANDILAGIVLIGAGAYQWSNLKNACLAQCRAPLSFIQRNGGFKREAIGSIKLGLLHGAYCVGCCWALMLLLFVGGVMNLLWIAGLAILVLLEKVLPFGRAVSRVTGGILIIGGAYLAYRGLFFIT